MSSPAESFKKLPKWGKAAALIGGAGVAYYIYKQHSSASASGSPASSSTSSGIDPVTGLPYSQDNQIDPLTGMTYLQEAQQYGSVAAAEAALAGGGAYGSGYYGNSGNQGNGSSGSYATNAQWAQAAESGLGAIGFNPKDVADALGRYLASLPVTNSEAKIIYAAIAEYGNPPVGTFSVILKSHKKHHGHHGDTVKMPDVINERESAAKATLTAAGLRVIVTGNRGSHHAHYVHSQSPAAGHVVPIGSAVHITVSNKP